MIEYPMFYLLFFVFAWAEDSYEKIFVRVSQQRLISFISTKNRDLQCSLDFRRLVEESDQNQQFLRQHAFETVIPIRSMSLSAYKKGNVSTIEKDPEMKAKQEQADLAAWILTRGDAYLNNTSDVMTDLVIDAWNAKIQQCNTTYPKLAGKEKLGCSWKVNGQSSSSVVKYACTILQAEGDITSAKRIAQSGIGGYFVHPCVGHLIEHGFHTKEVQAFVAVELGGKPNGALLQSQILNKRLAAIPSLIAVHEFQHELIPEYEDCSVGLIMEELISQENLPALEISYGEEERKSCYKAIKLKLNTYKYLGTVYMPTPKEPIPIAEDRYRFGPYCWK